MNNNFRKLDGKHKLAIFAAFIGWGLSVWFSYLGFRLDDPNFSWVGWILAFIVTVVELVFNGSTQSLSMTLIVAGILCYCYGVWTNVTGFWAIQHPDTVFIPLSAKSLMSWFVGTLLEILPEPLLVWGLGSKMAGDLLGNIAGLWKGELGYAQPDGKIIPPISPHPKSAYIPKHKPDFGNLDYYDDEFMKAIGKK